MKNLQKIIINGIQLLEICHKVSQTLKMILLLQLCNK